MAIIVSHNGAVQIASQIMRLRDAVQVFKSAGMGASMQGALAKQLRRENEVIRYASQAERELSAVLKADARTHTARLAGR